MRERRLLDQNTLPLVPPPATAPPHDHRGQAAGLHGALGQSGAAGRKKHKVIKVGTAKAERARILHPEQIAGAAALGAGPVPDRRNDHYAGGPLSLLHKASPPVLGTHTQPAKSQQSMPAARSMASPRCS